MRIGVTISRDWDDYEAVPSILEEFIHATPPWEITVVHGAYHMDWFVAGVAHALGMHTEPHPPDWKKYGKGAGPIRNRHMVDLGAIVWLAWIKNGSPGATHCAGYAEARGILVHRFEK